MLPREPTSIISVCRLELIFRAPWPPRALEQSNSGITRSVAPNQISTRSRSRGLRAWLVPIRFSRTCFCGWLRWQGLPYEHAPCAVSRSASSRPHNHHGSRPAAVSPARSMTSSDHSCSQRSSSTALAVQPVRTHGATLQHRPTSYSLSNFSCGVRACFAPSGTALPAASVRLDGGALLPWRQRQVERKMSISAGQARLLLLRRSQKAIVEEFVEMAPTAFSGASLSLHHVSLNGADQIAFSF